MELIFKRLQRGEVSVENVSSISLESLIRIGSAGFSLRETKGDVFFELGFDYEFLNQGAICFATYKIGAY